MKSPKHFSDNHSFPTVLRVFIVIVVSLWIASIVSAVCRSHPLSSGDGFQWIFFEGPAFDYYAFMGRVYYLHRPEFFTQPGYRWYYPAPAILPFQFFYGLGRICGTWLAGYLTYVLLVVNGVLYAAFRLAKALEQRGISRATALRFTLSAALFSWPIYFSLQRSNIEGLTWLVLAAGVWAYGRQRWMIAAILIGFVAAFKLYPVLCLALLLRPRKWKELAVGLLTMLLVTVCSLRYILPDVGAAARGVSNGMARFIDDYARSYGPASATYDHSLYEALKVVTLNHHPDYSTFPERYMLGIALLALMVFFWRVIWLPRTNQVLFLLTAAVCFPPASFDYTLQNLYIAFGWLVLSLTVSTQHLAQRRAMNCAVVLLAFVMGPETFILYNKMTAAGLLKGFLLLALLILSIVFPMGEPEVEATRSKLDRSEGSSFEQARGNA